MVVGISLIAAAPPAVNGVVSHQVRDDLKIMAGLAAFAALATIVWGALVGRRREHYWLWLAGAAGTGTLMLGYAIAMLASPADGAADNDNAAGAGVAIFLVPTAAIVLSCCSGSAPESGCYRASSSDRGASCGLAPHVAPRSEIDRRQL